MKRTFFAIPVPVSEQMRKHLGEIIREMAGEPVKWIPDHQLHFTLKFLGDTPDENIGPIVKSASAILKGLPGMIIRLHSIGVFKNLHSPRIIWIGAASGEDMFRIWSALNVLLHSHGYPAEREVFKPHLTLGRIRDNIRREKLKGLLEKYRYTSFGAFSVTEIVFYESILTLRGPQYIPLAVIPLARDLNTGSFENGENGVDNNFQIDID
jgi:2'-5' RNA ligase